MTRIVAGSAGGRRIEVPKSGTRPTSERVREALFSRLEHDGAVDAARVLDLYAGSGALGLEAASRGATDVTLVDAARPAVAVCQRNIRALGLPGVRTVCAKVETFLRGAAGAGVGMVLIDPPYDIGEDALAAVLALLARGGNDPWLTPGAVIVVERSTRSPEPTWPAGMESIASRKYGETILHFAETG